MATPQNDNQIITAIAGLQTEMQILTRSNEKIVEAIGHITAIQATNVSRDEKLKDHEDRIRELEGSVTTSSGVVKFLQWIGLPALAAILVSLSGKFPS